MTDVLARRYGFLMRAYPRAYREERGDEIVATLLERAGNRRWPPPGEVLGLLRGAVQAHLAPGGPARHTWTGGLRAAVLVLLAVELGRHLLFLLETGPAGRIGLVLILCGLVAFHAVRRDRRVLAVAATVGWQAAYVWAGTWSSGLVIASLLQLVLLAIGRRRPLPALHPGWWFLVPGVAVVLGGPGLSTGEPLYIYTYQQIVIIAAVVLLVALAWVDPRAAFVAAGLLAWQGLYQSVHLSWVGDVPGFRVFAHVGGTVWGYVAAGTAVVLLVGGHLVARRHAVRV